MTRAGRWRSRAAEGGNIESIEALGRLCDAMAREVRSGATVASALIAAHRAQLAPTGDEIARVCVGLESGESAADVLHHWALQATTSELRLLATTVAIAADVGGPVGPALDACAGVLRRRAELLDEVTVLTSQTRVSMRIMTWLPVAAALGTAALDRDAARFLVSLPGCVLVAVSAGLLVVGRRWVDRAVAGVR